MLEDGDEIVNMDEGEGEIAPFDFRGKNKNTEETTEGIEEAVVLSQGKMLRNELRLSSDHFDNNFWKMNIVGDRELNEMLKEYL
jgi:hypothetical protein